MTDSGLSNEQIKAAKSKGFLRNRGTECFSGRVVSPGGVYTPDQLVIIAECAHLFGSGKIAFTNRLSAEIVGIPYENIDQAVSYLKQNNGGLCFGGTGAKVRPVVACKGTTCVFGCYDTQELAKKIHDKYYIENNELLPHKFKIAIGGCPNSCMKPSLNDLGIEVRRTKGKVLFQIYAGGTWGKRCRVGDALSELIEEDEIFDVIDRTKLWFKENAEAKERLGYAIERLGIDHFEAFVLNK